VSLEKTDTKLLKGFYEKLAFILQNKVQWSAINWNVLDGMASGVKSSEEDGYDAVQ